MESAEVLGVLGNKYNAEILRAASEPKSAQELSDELDIPIATSYRRIEELTDADLLELSSRDFSDEGRRTKMYRRNIDAISIAFTESALEIELEERPEVQNSLVNVWSQLRNEEPSTR